MDNPTALLILQDPQEQQQAKGTAPLLQRCLRRVECRIGEHFEPPAALHGVALLYPETPGDRDLPMPPPWPDQAPHTLVLLDGTWRRSRRLLYLNPWLQRLPRLALMTPPPSRYAIRRAHSPRQRSSLEAAALALAQLEQASARYAPLWQAMDAFIALQQKLAARDR